MADDFLQKPTTLSGNRVNALLNKSDAYLKVVLPVKTTLLHTSLQISYHERKISQIDFLLCYFILYCHIFERFRLGRKMKNDENVDEDNDIKRNGIRRKEEIRRIILESNLH